MRKKSKTNKSEAVAMYYPTKLKLYSYNAQGPVIASAPVRYIVPDTDTCPAFAVATCTLSDVGLTKHIVLLRIIAPLSISSPPIPGACTLAANTTPDIQELLRFTRRLFSAIGPTEAPMQIAQPPRFTIVLARTTTLRKNSTVTYPGVTETP